MNSSDEYQKMERNALKVFLSLAGFILSFALWYSFSTGHNLAGELLLFAIAIITSIVLWINRPKTKQHEQRRVVMTSASV